MKLRNTYNAVEGRPAGRYHGLRKTMVALAAVLQVSSVAATGGGQMASAETVQYVAQALVVPSGATHRLAPGAYVFDLLQLDHGATLTLTGTTEIDARKLVANGGTQIRYEGTPSNADAKRLRLTVLDATDIASTLTIDGSGGHAQREGSAGEPGMTVQVTLVHDGAAIDLAHRFQERRGLFSGRLTVVARGGNGAPGKLGRSETRHHACVPETPRMEFLRGDDCGRVARGCGDYQVGLPGGNGGNGGAGGQVTVRIVIRETYGGAEWLGANRARTFAGNEYPSARMLYAEGLGVDIQVDPGAAGSPGRGGPGASPGQHGTPGSDGAVQWQMVNFATIAEELPAMVPGPSAEDGVPDESQDPSGKERRELM